MSYTLEHKTLPKYLEVHIKGTIVPGNELQGALERWSEVAELCIHVGRNKILAFLDLDGHHSLNSKFNLVDSAPSIGWRQDCRLSVVVKNEQQFQHLAFTETAMNNLGYEMKLFKKKREAKKWLFTL